MQVLLVLSLYLKLLSTHPDLSIKGDASSGEIELITDRSQIEQVQEMQKKRLLKKGYTKEAAENASRVGVVAEDPYWVWIRDAVTFPGGAQGTYDRLLWQSGLDGPAGVAVLPILADMRILLNLNYRHATRSWELELPRGGREKGESPEAAAQRELEEETGQRLKKQICLGTMAPDSGALGSLVPIYAGFVEKEGESHPEEGEAIEKTIALTFQEVREALAKGSLEVSIRGRNVSIPVRDSFLTFALFQAETLGLFTK